jgi:tRNA-dihydrouridine synthase B
MLVIGGLALPVPYVLAPMAGVSDLPFRVITRSFGAPLAFTEMIDARALSHGDRRTRHMLSSSRDDRPLGIQLVGNDENYLLKALDLLHETEFELLDFNAACPAPKLTRKGMGAALLKDPYRLRNLLEMLVRRSNMPVSVKIRAGWDFDSINAREVALLAEDAGVSALFIHGRTKTQGYSGAVNYGVIREVKRALSIPVIASGDNLTTDSIKLMFDETGCDGVAIARGALGNPWIFGEMTGHLRDHQEFRKPGVHEIVSVMKRHLDLVTAHYGGSRGVSCFRKFFIWYTRGISGAKPLRDMAFRADTKGALISVIEDLTEI